ncbi:protein FAM234A [Rhinophrynus dorsalis]
MDNKDLDTEIHPLRNDGKSQVNDETDVQKNLGNEKQRGLSRLSQCRTAAFFASLFLCLAVVFAFSFIIPCPVRPYSQKTWSVKHVNAVTYNFLATEDVNQDKVQDVIFLFKTDTTSNYNISCIDEGFRSPCSFLTALSGTDGSTLWARAVSEDVQLVECNIDNLGGVKSGCLIVGKPDSISAIDVQTGKILWQQHTGFEKNVTVTNPVMKIPDVNADGVQDLMLVVKIENELQFVIFSGLTGDRIGQNSSIGRKGGHYMFVTNSGAQYMLIYKGDAIEGYSVRDLYSRIAGAESKSVTFKQDPDWEGRANHSAGYISILPISSSGDILYLLSVPGRSYTNLLILKSEVSEMLDGQKLTSLWSMNTTNLLSKPALGYFKKDVLSIIMEVGIGNGRKKVIIVESSSGTVQWEMQINSGHTNPNPDTLNTVDHRSTFFFWGDFTTELNNTMEPNENLYMFHPTRPNVLLQLKNHTESIVAFDAVLFEGSRHACYILVTGPKTTENPGNVTVTKRKLKEDITNGKVIWLSKEEDSNQAIRDYFFRIRYTSHS